MTPPLKSNTIIENVILCVYKNDEIVKELVVPIKDWFHQYLSRDSKVLSFKYKDPMSLEFLKTDINEHRANIKFIESEKEKSILNIDKWLSNEPYKPILFTDQGYYDWEKKKWMNFDDHPLPGPIHFETRPEIEKMSKSYFNVVNPGRHY